jgi:hypothetical protein
MKEKAYFIGNLVDLRDVIDRLINSLSNSSLFSPLVEQNFNPLLEREYQEHKHWPPADINYSRLSWQDRSVLAAQEFGFDLQGRVLEYTAGSSPVISENYSCNAEIVLDCDYKFDINDAVIHKDIGSVNGEFDFIVIYESLSFCEQPAMIMSQLRNKLHKDGKLVWRVRPWTAPAGGFQETYHNWAYAHLLVDLPHNDRIKWRVLQPLREYDQIITQCGYISITRAITSVPLISHLKANGEAFQILKERTWGEIDNNEARAILPIKHIDYVLMKT